MMLATLMRRGAVEGEAMSYPDVPEAGIEAASGEMWRYPLTIRFVNR